MATLRIIEREMTDVEFARMNAGFDEHTVEHGGRVEVSERFGFVAMDGPAFVGCSSGLAYRSDAGYSRWFYLSDLFVEQPCRGQGLGAALLTALEERVAPLGVEEIWTWTAGYEAPGFYTRMGYRVFAEMERWYPGGESRFGFRKTLGTGQAGTRSFA